MNDLTINVFGLDDPAADLTIVGQCDACGAELWRRSYKENEYKHLHITVLLSKVQADVKGDRDKLINHQCVVH